jgi:hypothetical protein
VFLTDETSPSAALHRLYQVPVNGGHTEVELGQGSDELSVFSFELSQDGTRVALVEGFGGSLDWFETIAINATQRVVLATGQGPDRFQLAPDGSRVIFEQGGELVSVASDGTQRVQFPVGTGTGFQISPDGSRIAYSSAGLLFSTPIGGGIPMQLADPGVGPELSHRLHRRIVSQTLPRTQAVRSWVARSLLLNGTLAGRSRRPAKAFALSGTCPHRGTGRRH